MFCPKCGNKLEPNSRFCNRCGNLIQTNNYQQPNPIQNQYSNYQNIPIYQQPSYQANYKQQKENNNTIMIIIIIVALLILIFGLFMIFNGNSKGNNIPVKERTLMLYMTGSNLESNGAYATAELNAIIPTNIDLKNTNVVVVAGGAITWHNNYINRSETAIFELTENGFNKVKTYQPVRNMGDPTLFSDFLTYAYENYKAEGYSLLMWNHGSGIFGSNSDELTNDSLNPIELQTALKNSPFNSSNKLDYVAYIACLMANIENAIIWSDYADYLIASEEVSYLSLTKNFKLFAESSYNDSAITIGTNFITNYQSALKKHVANGGNFNGFNSGAAAYQSQTFSLIDLSKIKDLKNSISDFFQSLNVQNNYNAIAKIRSNMPQYGSSEKNFNAIDIYTIVNQLKSLSPTKGEKVLSLIKETIKYNFSGNNYSNGLSIYFPYYGKDNVIQAATKIRSNISPNDQYNNFISKFLSIKNGNGYSSWAFEENNSSFTSSIKVNSEFGFYLTSEESNNFANANYQVFRKYNNGYIPIYSSSNIEFDENKNYIKVNYTNKGLKVNNEIKNLYMKEISRYEDTIVYEIPVRLYDDNNKVNEALITYAIDKDNPTGYINTITYKSTTNENEVTLPNVNLVNLKDYKYIEFNNTAYNITKENKYVETWEKVEDVDTTKLAIENLEFELVDLADNYDYVAVIQVYDVYGNGHYTPLINIEN